MYIGRKHTKHMAAFTFYFSAHAGMQYGKKNSSIHCHCIPKRLEFLFKQVVWAGTYNIHVCITCL